MDKYDLMKLIFTTYQTDVFLIEDLYKLTGLEQYDFNILFNKCGSSKYLIITEATVESDSLVTFEHAAKITNEGISFVVSTDKELERLEFEKKSIIWTNRRSWIAIIVSVISLIFTIWSYFNTTQ